MFLYFQDNYKWSLGVALALNAMGSGGAEIGDIESACGPLRAGAAGLDDVGAWHDAWRAVAERSERLGDAARAAGDAPSAARALLRACNYFQLAERMLHPDDPRKSAAYLRSLDAMARCLDGLPQKVERVRVPYLDGSLGALYVHAEGGAAGPAPAVVFFDGLDVNKEQLYMFAGHALARYGLGVLIVDAPGSGEALRLHDIKLRHDMEVAAAACVDYLHTRPDVDAQRLGFLAVSLGGHHATRVAAFEKRIRAVAAWGGVWDYQAVWQGRRRLNAASAVSADHAHIGWMLGVDGIDAVIAALAPYKLADVAPRVDGPFLVVHGALDRQVPLSHAQQLYEAVPSARKKLVVIERDNEGAHHAQIDQMAAAHAALFPWLREQLTA